MKYTQHPLSAAFPALSDEEYLELKNSIQNIGVQNPITIFEGQVIDGWHRYKAACDLGIECPTINLNESIDPRDFVLAQNRARRHVGKNQLAMAVTAVYQWLPSGRPKKESDEKLRTECGIKEPDEKLRTECGIKKTTIEMAAIAGVSERSIEQAKKVRADAIPEVVDAVRQGAIGLAKAEAISKLPKEQQAEAISKPLKAIKPAKQKTPDTQEEGDIGDEIFGSTEELLEEISSENRELQSEIARLKEVIESQASDDQKSENLRLHKLCDHFKREKQLADSRSVNTQKNANYTNSWITKFCKALSQEDWKQALNEIKSLRELQALVFARLGVNSNACVKRELDRLLNRKEAA